MTRSRALAWAAVAGQAIFVAGWLIAGALEPGYSHLEHYVSELGAGGAENPWIVNAAIVLLGLSFAALALAVRPVLPPRPASEVAVAALVLVGLGFAVAGVFPLDCLRAADVGCQARWDEFDVSAQHAAHAWAAFIARGATLVAAFALARALWPRPVAVLALVSGVIGVAIAALLTAANGQGPEAAEGLWQRWSLANLHLGVLLVAVGVLWEARREPEPSPPAPMRPRDFFGRSWSGDGEVVLRPDWLGRRAPLRFRATRTARWLNDDAWVFEDTAAFDNGYTEQRRVFCEFVTPERVEVVAGHLPDGTTADFEPGGYRIHPYRLAVPLGPMLVPLSCRDRHHIDADGTLRDVIDLMIGPLRIGRVTMRVRRDDD
ncbi:MAG TPA: DUF998 domain-containing protein [Solirubrobacteraceae bacterium]|nr:DUF998 domain-containing protein [Solirubrobacteraceae bacterium]